VKNVSNASNANVPNAELKIVVQNFCTNFISQKTFFAFLTHLFFQKKSKMLALKILLKKYKKCWCKIKLV